MSIKYLKVERKEARLFDKDAFREVVNAFLHNRKVDMNEPMIIVYSAWLKYYHVEQLNHFKLRMCF